MTFTPEAVPPLLSVAAGCAAGIVYLWKIPAKTHAAEESKWYTERIERLEKAVAHEEQRSDHLRRKLAECQAELSKITDIRVEDEDEDEDDGSGHRPGQ